jgi:hypothetical protein
MIGQSPLTRPLVIVSPPLAPTNRRASRKTMIIIGPMIIIGDFRPKTHLSLPNDDHRSLTKRAPS